jgi:hypothetical protein
VDAQIVHHDDVSGMERRHQAVPNPPKEKVAPIHDQRGRQARGAKGSKERRRLPVAVRHAGQQSFALGCTPAWPGHVRLGPRFVDKHEPIQVQERLLSLELLTPLRDIRPLTLRSDEHFFCRSGEAAATPYTKSRPTVQY